MGQMRMRSAVSGPLGEGQVLLLIQIINPLGGEHLDGLRQQMGVIRHLDPLGNLRLGFLGRMDDRVFTLDERPLISFFCAVDIETLAVLAGGVKQRTIYAGECKASSKLPRLRSKTASRNGSSASGGLLRF